MDSKLSRYPPPMLEFFRTEIAQRGMTARPIVEYFNVVKDPIPRLGSSRVETRVNFLYFQRVKERLGAGIVVAIAFATHALAKPSVRQGPSEGPTGRLAVPVGVEDHAFAR